MKNLFLLLLFVFLGTGFAFAQETENVQGTEAEKPAEGENIVSHSVAMGETVMLISKKYKVTPYDIYELNPDAIEGITQNMVLRIPMHKSHKAKDVRAGKAKDAKKIAQNDQQASIDKAYGSNK